MNIENRSLYFFGIMSIFLTFFWMESQNEAKMLRLELDYARSNTSEYIRLYESEIILNEALGYRNNELATENIKIQVENIKLDCANLELQKRNESLMSSIEELTNLLREELEGKGIFIPLLLK